MPKLRILDVQRDICPVTGKIQYASMHDAMTPARFTSKMNDATYDIYYCKYCGKYHVGKFHEWAVKKNVHEVERALANNDRWRYESDGYYVSR